MQFLMCAFIVLLLIILVAALWFINYLLIKLPEQQMNNLEAFALMAVKRTEQLHPIFEEAQKYYDAVGNLKDIFEEFRIHLPGDSAIDTAIRAAIYTIWKEQELIGLERLKDQLDKANIEDEDTQEVKVLPGLLDTDSLDRILGV